MPYELFYFHDLVETEILTPEARMKLWMKEEYDQKLESIGMHTKIFSISISIPSISSTTTRIGARLSWSL